MEAAVLSTILTALSTLGVWLVTQAQARNRSTRKELRWRRKVDLLNSRYIHRLEKALSDRDRPLPDKPQELTEIEAAASQGEEDW